MLQRAIRCSSLARAALAPCSAPVLTPGRSPEPWGASVAWGCPEEPSQGSLLPSPLCPAPGSVLLPEPRQGTGPWGRWGPHCWEAPKEGKPSCSFHTHLCKFGVREVNCFCSSVAAPGGEDGSRCWRSLPVLSTFSFFSISGTATGPSSEAADAKSCVAPVGAFPGSFRAQQDQLGV